MKDLLEDLDTGAVDIEITGFSENEIQELMSQFHMDDPPDIEEDDFDIDGALESIREPRTKSGICGFSAGTD